tara:strand:+ start:464 stop:763 length:300 start_codon:yes stop_codon:yes gene_type:complete
MRYKNVKIISKKGGKRAQSSYIMKNVPELDGDTYVETTIADRLDLLANQFYGDPKLWWVIANANNIGKGTLFIEEGAVLRIPANPKNVVANNNNNISGY